MYQRGQNEILSNWFSYLFFLMSLKAISKRISIWFFSTKIGSKLSIFTQFVRMYFMLIILLTIEFVNVRQFDVDIAYESIICIHFNAIVPNISFAFRTSAKRTVAIVSRWNTSPKKHKVIFEYKLLRVTLCTCYA